MARRKAFSADCTKVMLETGTGDPPKFLDVAPTMQTITHGGKKYFRTTCSKGQDPADGQWGLLYLWDGYGDWLRKKYKVGKYAEQSKEPTDAKQA